MGESGERAESAFFTPAGGGQFPDLIANALTLAGGTSSPYTVSGPSTLAAGAMGTVTVTPRPVPAVSSTAPDAFADTLSIVATGGPVNETQTVALHETAQGAVLTLNPGSLTFGGNSSKNFTGAPL